MRESGYYYPGTEFDPAAPWNARENPHENLDEALGSLRSLQDQMNAVMDMIGKREFQRRFDVANSGFTVDFNHYAHRLELAIMEAMSDIEDGEWP